MTDTLYSVTTKSKSIIFIALRHAMRAERAILFYQFCLSVRLSVRPMPVLCLNEWMHIVAIFDRLITASF